MQVINASIDDIEIITSLENNRFTTDAWNKKQWENEFKQNEFSYILLLKDNEEIIGYIDFWILFEQATINKICIKKDKEGNGCGSYLLNEALKIVDSENCLSTSLEVRVSNTKAIKLYEKFLFKKILTIQKYYSDGEDCYFMIRSIGDVYEG